MKPIKGPQESKKALPMQFLARYNKFARIHGSACGYAPAMFTLDLLSEAGRTAMMVVPFPCSVLANSKSSNCDRFPGDPWNFKYCNTVVERSFLLNEDVRAMFFDYSANNNPVEMKNCVPKGK